MSIKDERIKEVLRKEAAEFLRKESSGASLITVTSVELRPRANEATIFFTVLPDTLEEDALAFAKRKRSEFREHLKAHTKLPFFPSLDFAIDKGEKNRQRIDDLLQNS